MELHAYVRGLVQGVFFRQSTQQRASRWGLVGWVRNLPDGGVEVLAQGDRSALEQLLAFLRHGPPEAVVSGVEVEWGSPTQSYDGFGNGP